MTGAERNSKDDSYLQEVDHLIKDIYVSVLQYNIEKGSVPEER